jgi:renalase
MTALPEWLAVGLDVHLNSQADAIGGEPGRWFVRVKHRWEGPFDWIIVTAPAPQSAIMLAPRFAHR